MVYILPLPITDPLSEWEMGGVWELAHVLSLHSYTMLVA